MDPRMNRASSRPNAPRLTIVNHCRVAALSPSTRRLTDTTVRLLVLVRSDGVTRKYVHRARARVFARAPSRSPSRSSTFALDSACACASHTRGVLAREKKKQVAVNENQKVGGGRDDSNGRFERERVERERVDASRSVRCGRRRELTPTSRHRDDADDADDADDRGPRRERGRTAVSPRTVGRPFIRLARARNENESRQTRDDGWMPRTLGEVVRSSPSPGDGNVSLSRPRSRASSVRRRRRDSRRRDDRQRMYPRVHSM